MEIQVRSIAELSADPANARKHNEENIRAIMASLRRFGQQTPIVVDSSGVVRKGNGTIEAARKLGWDSVQCVTTDLKGSEAISYAIADNRTAELAEWDDEVLAAQLNGLLADDPELLDAAGFDEDELAAMLDELEPDKEIVEDEVPEPPADPITKLGDLWILGEHRLLCGDSTKAEDVARLMNGTKAEFCFTSPPYNLGKSVALRNGARNGADSAYNDFADNGEWADLIRGFIANTIRFADVSCVNVQMLSGNKIDLLRLFGEHASHTVDIAVWTKSNPPPAMADGVMTSAFEFMWFLSSEEKPNRRIKSASFLRGTFSNVFEHATASGHDASVHGAVFPLPVAEHFIRNCSQQGDRVLEFFCGSGTTLIAAEQLGRRCYGMEISPAYCDVIVKRWETLTGKQAYRDGHS